MVAQPDDLPSLSEPSIHERITRLVRQAGPDAVREDLQGAFADEAEGALMMLGEQAWRSQASAALCGRASQILDDCWDRLDCLRELPSSVGDGQVAYHARGIARDLDVAYYLLSARKTGQAGQPRVSVRAL
jgi:hypothetical protein